MASFTIDTHLFRELGELLVDHGALTAALRTETTALRALTGPLSLRALWTAAATLWPLAATLRTLPAALWPLPTTALWSLSGRRGATR